MYTTTDGAGKTVWFCIQPDAEFDTYGYYVEVYRDENGNTRIDYFNTYNFDEKQSAQIARTRIKSVKYYFE